jgi:hypothetical protein
MKTRLVFYALSCILMTSCADSTNNERSQTGEENKMATEASTKQSGIKIRNNIKLQTSGLNVSQAFLLYEDGSLVPPDNVTNVGRPVKLRLIIDGGWEKEDGNVYIGASEKIETSEGQVILDEKDLFSHMPYISADDARYITLTATISGLDKLYDYFLVSFRVWDKKGKGEVTGSYKLHVN